MAVHGCVTLLFILLSGIVHAEDLVTSSLPATQEFSTSKILSGSSSPTTSKHSSAAISTAVTTGPTTHHTTTKYTTEPTTTPHFTTTKSTTEPTTTPHFTTTKSTTEPTTTPHHTTTKSTTEPPTTMHHNTTNSTTEAPTTMHHNTTNSTTEAPTTMHHNTTNSTTEAPTTMHHNTTNSTTEAPTTTHSNATTAPTPPPTTPPVPNPTVGNYSVKSDNVTVCLLAKMGLQFSFKMSENSSFQTLNFDPSANVTEVSGTCGSGGNDSSLLLKSDEITVHFVFTNVSQKFRLHALTLSVNLENGNVFNASNNNLSLWEASVGSSYMCRKEQSYNITDKLTLNTFQLQVQPFAVQNNKFNTVEECFLDSDLRFLVPIAVGVALSFLIILVLISYLIGRRKSRTGYQSV
ncbi:lysosome-associated membrane glycoprotein 2-like isoform X1 [Sinocyclocheilus rhinocerous]|uniref:lysosome-associated membrane glycoprotein 2-like isoform X1 n=1 Tax=Sinocyclocheilus rhinocerous TaxID=307959 RepID=UPI0007B7CB2E|nr:PREDICTED: lysosome-associated membrane glycoprotein 2-like isoform X1 [Sinocyclocheilus rhinocerous]